MLNIITSSNFCNNHIIDENKINHIDTYEKDVDRSLRYNFIIDEEIVVQKLCISYNPHSYDLYNNPDLNTLLHQLIRANNMKLVKNIVSQGINLNDTNVPFGFTPIYYACEYGNIGMVKLFIDKGANLNLKNEFGITPLHVVARKNYTNIAELLIRKGMRVNTNIRENGITPLHFACMYGYLDMIKFLIENGCGVNDGVKVTAITNHEVYNLTPLHIATRFNEPKIVKYLLEMKASVNAKTSDKVTPLHIASQFGNLEIVRLLLKYKADINEEDYNNNTALHLAAEQNHLDICISLLLTGNTNINIINKFNQTPLHKSAQGGKTEIIKLLLAKRSNLKSVTVDGHTPLHLAVRFNNTEASRVLIFNGSNVNAADSQDWTPLHLAAYVGSLRNMKYLLENGANIDAKTKEGKTALNITIQYGPCKEIVAYLILQGANVDDGDNMDWTPLHTATFKGLYDIAKILLEHNANVNAKTIQHRTPLHCAAYNNHVKLVQLLLQCGANVHDQDGKSWSALHFAAARDWYESSSANFYHKQLEVVKILTENSADVNMLVNEYVTPMNLAILSKNLSVINYLLTKGAFFDKALNDDVYNFINKCKNSKLVKIFDKIKLLFQAIKENCLSDVKICIEGNDSVFVNIKSVRFITPLMYAIINRHSNIIKYLLWKGADIHMVAEDGSTVLHYAVTLNDYNIACTLLEYGAVFNGINLAGKTPLDYACELGNSDIEYLLKIIDDLFVEVTTNFRIDFVYRLSDFEKTNPSIFKAVKYARHRVYQQNTLLDLSKKGIDNLKEFIKSLHIFNSK